MSEVKECPWCGIEPRLFGKDKAQCINEFNCPNAYGRPIPLDEWQVRPIEDALRAENEALRRKIAQIHKIAKSSIYDEEGLLGDIEEITKQDSPSGERI